MNLPQEKSAATQIPARKPVSRTSSPLPVYPKNAEIATPNFPPTTASCPARSGATRTRVRLEGRMQSRAYIKLTDTGPLRRTAYEISAMELERLEES